MTDRVIGERDVLRKNEALVQHTTAGDGTLRESGGSFSRPIGSRVGLLRKPAQLIVWSDQSRGCNGRGDLSVVTTKTQAP
jgi:hypothetical protein